MSQNGMGSIGDQLLARGVKVVGQKAGSSGQQSPRFKLWGLKIPVISHGDQLIPDQTERERRREQLDGFIREIGPVMQDWMTQLWRLEEMSPEEAAMYGEERRIIEDQISEVLNAQEPFRTIGRIAWADALVRNCPDERRLIQLTIDKLVRDGFLIVSEPAGSGKTIKLYGNKYYRLGPEFSSKAEAQGVLVALERLIVKAADKGRGVFEEQKYELELSAADQISLDDFRQGKDGRIILDVPDKSTTDGRFFRGGPVLFENKDGRIRVIDSAGIMQRTARKLAESGISLGIEQVGLEKIQLIRQVPQEEFRTLIGIHDMARRAIESATKKRDYRQLVATERDALRSRATVTPTAFYLEGKPGIVYFDFGRKPFEKRSGNDVERIWDVFCLIERAEDLQIRVLECPERLKAFFGGALDWGRPDEQFRGLAFPLNVLLRMGYAMARSGEDNFSGEGGSGK